MAQTTSRTLTQRDLVRSVAGNIGISQDTVEAVLEALAVAVVEHLKADGGTVTIPGLAKLEMTYRNGRKCRNPATGQPIQIPAKSVVRARPLPRLSAMLDSIA